MIHRRAAGNGSVLVARRSARPVARGESAGGRIGRHGWRTPRGPGRDGCGRCRNAAGRVRSRVPARARSAPLRMSFGVRILPRASSDADSIFHWLAGRSPRGAARWYAALLSAAASLAVDPLRHGIAPESNTVGREIRQRFFKTPRGRVYRLLFVVVEHEVRILRIRGPGQPPVTSPQLDP